MPQAPFRHVDFVEPRVEVERRTDGSIVLRNPHPAGEPPPNVLAPLREWARNTPERSWLAERENNTGPWRVLTYADGAEKAERIATALIKRGHGVGGPRHGAVMILSGNSLEHALMSYGAMWAGVPVAPVSRAYSLMSSDFAKLDYVFELIKPKVIFVQDGQQFAKALSRLDLTDVEVVYVKNAPPGIAATPFDELLSAPARAEDVYAKLNHATVAKYLFTSGSTGMPKAVINTHGMLCMNSVMGLKLVRTWASDEPPVMLSWLPWNHTFGGNSVLNAVMARGGTLYLDGGAPVPGQFELTVRNLKEVSPTSYSNVPAGYGMLVDALERDDELAEAFFKRLRSLAYGGAALSQDLYDRLQNVAVKKTGERIVFTTGYGATETGPTVMSVHWATERMGLLGLPLPAVEVKLVPQGAKYEVRVRGASITPGYHKREDLTAKAFDDEGFYSLGDAAKFVDPQDPVKGLVFDGRIAEDFKLDTGTWVNAGRLRVQAVEAGQGLLQDALIAGRDRAYVGILAWPNLAACRNQAGASGLTPAEICRNAKVLECLADALRTHNAKNPGSSTQIRRTVLLEEPPSLDAGEITDKGYINQAAALSRRARDVERLYADPPGNDIIAV